MSIMQSLIKKPGVVDYGVRLSNVSGITRYNFATARVTLYQTGTLWVTTFSSYAGQQPAGQWYDTANFPAPQGRFYVRFNGGAWQLLNTTRSYSQNFAGSILVEICPIEDQNNIVDSATYTFN